MHTNGNHKMEWLYNIRKKVDYGIKIITTGKERCFIMVKGAFYQEK